MGEGDRECLPYLITLYTVCVVNMEHYNYHYQSPIMTIIFPYFLCSSMAVATCEKCDEYYKDPRMLPCLHTYCLCCLEKEMESQTILHCPNCKEEVTLSKNGVSDLPQDLHKANQAEIARISEKVEDTNEHCEACRRSDTSGKAVAFCIDCKEFLCKICTEWHGKRYISAEHTVVTAGERLDKTNDSFSAKTFHQKQMLCPFHKGRFLEIYCKQCEKLICEYCMKFDEHSKHECEYFEKVAKEEMEDLRARLGNCEGALSSLDEAIAKCNQTMQKVETRKTEVDTAINNSLEQVRKALLAQNEGIRSRKIMGLKAQVNELQRIRDGLSHAFTMITAAKDHSPVQQLSTKKALAERAAELKKGFEGSKLVPSKSDTFTTSITNSDTISQMISLGCVSGGAHAASSTCDVSYVPRAVVGKQRTVKVVGKDKEGKRYSQGGDKIEAKLILKHSQDPAIQGVITDHDDGSYSVSITAQSAGEHEFRVTIDNNDIRGSPFKYNVMQARQTPYTALSGAQQYLPTNSSPNDVAVTEEGHLAVAEYGSHTVTLYSKTGQKVHMFGTAGGYGTADGQFHSPSAVAIKGDLLYVCESGNKRVQKFSISQQSFISKFGTGGKGDGQFSNPSGICIDPEGNVFIADYSNHRIQVFRDNDSFAYSFPCQNGPWGLAFDLQGHLHVAVSGSSCINVYTPEGIPITSYGSGTISSPAGIAIDAEGCIAISQNQGSNSGCFWIYSPDHTLIRTLSHQFNSGLGIACDCDGSFWVADHDNSRIAKF